MKRSRTGAKTLLAIGLSIAFIGQAASCGLPNPLMACQYPSIQAALDDAPADWQVFICAGTHEEALKIQKKVRIFGDTQNGTVLTGGGAESIVEIANAPALVRLEGLTLKPPAGSTATRTGVAVSDSGAVVLTGLTIDFRGVGGLADSSTLPKFKGYIGVDIDTAAVTLANSTIESIGPADFVSPGLRVHGSSRLVLDSVELNNSGGPAILASDSEVEINRSTIRRSVTDGLAVLSGNVHVTNTTIDGVGRDGISVSNGYLHGEQLVINAPLRDGVVASGGLVDLSQTQITGSGDGIHATFGAVTAFGCTITDARDHGLYAHDSGFIIYNDGLISGGGSGVLLDYLDAYITLSNSRITNPSGRGIEMHNGQLLVSGGSIERAGQEGLFADGGELQLDLMTIALGRGDGVLLRGTAKAGLGQVKVLSNGGFGIQCDGGFPGNTNSSVQLNACTGHFSGNTAGETHLFNGCQLLYLCIETGV